MTKYEAFLMTPIEDAAAFSRALLGAARELRSAELGVTVGALLLDGDVSASRELNASSLRPVQSAFQGSNVFDIPVHLQRVTRSWEEKGTATVLRGTRLPDPAGSFDIGGIHATPQFAIASGYAGGSANSDTGTGRLLKRGEIGFITAYEVPLNQKTYKNFQYEDALEDPQQESTTTLNDLKRAMQELSKRAPSEFCLLDDDQASEAQRQWDQLASAQQHYEVILPDECKPSALYLRHAQGLIEIDRDSPKWAAVLARVQEASLRDFYEIKPLDTAMHALSRAERHTEGDAAKAELLARASDLLATERSLRIHAPWEATSLADVSLSGSPYVDSRPYITQSVRVGSAMAGSHIAKPERIEELAQVALLLQADEFAIAQQLMASLLPDGHGFGQESVADVGNLALERASPGLATRQQTPTVADAARDRWARQVLARRGSAGVAARPVFD